MTDSTAEPGNNTGRLMSMWCGAGRDVMLSATCSRTRTHGGEHRGPEKGTGRLVSWPASNGYDDDVPGPLDETAERWVDNPDGWPSDGGTVELESWRRPELAGVWHVVSIVGPPLAWGVALAAAWMLPALVILTWRHALT